MRKFPRAWVRRMSGEGGVKRALFHSGCARAPGWRAARSAASCSLPRAPQTARRADVRRGDRLRSRVRTDGVRRAVPGGAAEPGGRARRRPSAPAAALGLLRDGYADNQPSAAGARASGCRPRSTSPRRVDDGPRVTSAYAPRPRRGRRAVEGPGWSRCPRPVGRGGGDQSVDRALARWRSEKDAASRRSRPPRSRPRRCSPASC